MSSCVSTVLLIAIAAFLRALAQDAGKRALVLVDVQDCFLPGGSLAVDAAAIIPEINKIRDSKDCLFDVVIRSQDFHPAGHISFASTNGLTLSPSLVGAPIALKCIKPTSGKTADGACCPDPDGDLGAFAANKSAIQARKDAMTGNPACTTCFAEATKGDCFDMMQSMWPDHCLQTGDSTFPSNLVTKTTDKIMKKGSNQWVDAYSAFMDNTKSLKTPLDSLLKQHGITEVFVGGIATDFCVLWTIEDAVALKYDVTLIEGAEAGINIGGTSVAAAKQTMDRIGVKTVSVADVLAMECAAGPSGSSMWVLWVVLVIAALGVGAFFVFRPKPAREINEQLNRQ